MTQMLAWPAARATALLSWAFTAGLRKLAKVWRSGWTGRIVLAVLAGFCSLNLLGLIFLSTFFSEPSVRTVLQVPFARDWSAGFEAMPSWFNWTIEHGIRSAMAASLGIALLTTLLFLIWFVSIVLLALSLWTFGTSLLYAGPFAEMVVEPVPRGIWPLHRLGWLKDEQAEETGPPLGFSHGEPYATPEAQEAMFVWLREVCTRAGADPPDPQ